MATPTARLTPAPTVQPFSKGRAVDLGFWMAGLTVLVTLVFAVCAVATPARSGPFCTVACVPSPYVDVARFIPNDYLWLIPGILLAPIFVGLMASIHSHAAVGNKAFSGIALSFAVVYAVVILVDYFVQLTVVIPSLQSGETQGLSLFTQYNPHGLFIALEVLAYIAMSASLLATAPLFAGGRIESAIRWLFVLGFVLTISAFTGFWLYGHDLVAVEVSVLVVDWVVLIVGGALLSIVLWRRARA